MRSTRATRLPLRHRAVALAALALLAGAGVWSGSARAASTPETMDPRLLADDELTDRLIVRYRTPAVANAAMVRPTAMAMQRLQAAGLQAVAAHRNGLGAQVLRLNRPARATELRALARQLMADDPQVLYAEPDLRLQALATPTDPFYSSQWHYHEPKGGLRLPAAWDLSTGDGVVVGVLDTGVRAHPDLAANLLSGYDFITSASMANDGDGRDTDADDPGDGCNGGRSSWHGTHVAGTVAAVSNNGEGVAGVAPAARILPVRVLGCGGGYFSDIADGILWASGQTVGAATAPPQPARVINMSLGGKAACPVTLQNAINAARAVGTVVVVAAGNANQDASLHTPANCAGVVTVAATGRAGGRAYYSNYGAKIDVAAPGGDQRLGSANGVLSTLNDGYSAPAFDSYAFYQGTSMAAPHVAGVAALMLARNPSLTPDEIEGLLKSTARPLPVACSVGCGRGLVDAAAAVSGVFVGASAATLVSEVEPNDPHATAQTLDSLPVKVGGTIATSVDLDTYKVVVSPGQTLTARLIGNQASNYDLYLRNTANVVIKSSVRLGGLSDNISWRNGGGTAATVFLRVRRVSGTLGAAGTYKLEANLQ